MFVSNSFLKLFYNFMLGGMPSLTANPINKNVLHAPFLVNSYSTYINYRLNNNQYNRIKHFLRENDNNFDMLDTAILKKTNREYFLSINIYNCTSPVFDFLTDGPATRCEINTYVVDKNDLKGTLIMDYVSNVISLDPDNLFKKKGNIKFEKKDDIIRGYADNNNFNLEFNYNSKYNIDTHRLSSKLIRFTDVIFYNCGLYDKLYYDSSLIENNIINCYENDVKFNFLDLQFDEVHSVFYFEKNINFIGGMWANIFKE